MYSSGRVVANGAVVPSRGPRHQEKVGMTTTDSMSDDSMSYLAPGAPTAIDTLIPPDAETVNGSTM